MNAFVADLDGKVINQLIFNAFQYLKALFVRQVTWQFMRRFGKPVFRPLFGL